MHYMPGTIFFLLYPAVKFHPNYCDECFQLKLTYNIMNAFYNLWPYNSCTVMAWRFENEQLYAVIYVQDH